MASSVCGHIMPDIHLNPADKAIVSALREGRNVPSNIADDTGYGQQYVRDRLARLEEWDIVENIGRGVYELDESKLPDEG